jgi:hypothetical protein
MNRLNPNDALIRIADVHNPSNWHSFSKALSGPWHVFQAPNYGWMITFLRVPSGPASPIVTPTLLPTHEPSDPADNGWSASVALPEASGLNEYWVTVLEQYRWAQLQTAEWTVLFMKLPSP